MVMAINQSTPLTMESRKLWALLSILDLVIMRLIRLVSSFTRMTSTITSTTIFSTSNRLIPLMVCAILFTSSPVISGAARNLNIAVPPLGQDLDEMLSVPGHMIPTEMPVTAQATRPTAGPGTSDAIR